MSKKLEWVDFREDHLHVFFSKDAEEMKKFNCGSFVAEHIAKTALLDGIPVACGGCHPFIFNTKMLAWALFEPAATPHLLEITRYVKEYIKTIDIPRLECHVLDGFPQGYKFARAVGFQCETPKPLRNFTFDLQSCYIFSIIK